MIQRKKEGEKEQKKEGHLPPFVPASRMGETKPGANYVNSGPD
jgi:hypothetical protein